jgi:predicted SAM-dependent methyltransferase
MIFPESKLAHKYCKGSGIEIGAAAHNPFGLENCLNIGIPEDEEFYRQHQIDMCGEFAEIDIYARADQLPFEDNSLDYVVSSHVVEHLYDLIGTFYEWNRVVKNQGVIFIIFPKCDALPEDIGRPISSIPEFVYNNVNPPEKFDSTHHVWIFTLELMVNLINFCSGYFNIHWDVIDKLETDDKVGNGHCVVCRVNK